MDAAVRAAAALEIPNLLYRCAEAFDAGRFDEAAALFDHGRLVASDQVVQGREAIVAFWRRWVRLYGDGTPRTRHLIHNPIIEWAPDGTSARCRSVWTLWQQVQPGEPPRLLATGRYEDTLGAIDGSWCFLERRYAGIDMAGPMASHLLRPLAEGVEGR
jgi:3-phenylpropionate/cinnamic acid dioxygenase small subunit